VIFRCLAALAFLLSPTPMKKLIETDDYEAEDQHDGN